MRLPTSLSPVENPCSSRQQGAESPTIIHGASKWGARFPVITQQWLDAWEHVIPFLAFPDEVRRVIYTTNAIEALNRQLRKAIKTKGSFPNEDAARKLIYLAVRNATPQWTRCRNWTTALLAFKIHFGDRLPDTAA